MNNPLQALIQMGVVPPVTFPTDSRYYGSSTLTYTTPGGQSITYLARRLVAAAGRTQLLHRRPVHRKTGRPA